MSTLTFCRLVTSRRTCERGRDFITGSIYISLIRWYIHIANRVWCFVFVLLLYWTRNWQFHMCSFYWQNWGDPIIIILFLFCFFFRVQIGWSIGFCRVCRNMLTLWEIRDKWNWIVFVEIRRDSTNKRHFFLVWQMRKNNNI